MSATALFRSIANPTDRTILVIAVLLIFTAGLWNNVIGSYGKFGPLGWLTDNSGLDIGEILAFAALLKIFASIGDRSILRRSDLVALMVLLVGTVLPYSTITWISATAIGVAFVFWRRDEPLLSSIGQILIASAVHAAWGPKFFMVAAPYFVNLEATFAASLLTTFSKGYSAQFNQIAAQNGHTIEIFAGCSAFHNLSLAALIWISIIKLQRMYFTRLDFFALAGTFAVVILINEIRIMLMARSYAYYVFWHDGAGVTIMSAAMLVSISALLLMTSLLTVPSFQRG
jgi:hypothetical protein